MNNFGIKLKELRLSKNLTQEQLAKQVHVTKQSVSKWEQGKSLPNIEIIEILATFFEISIDLLIGNEIRNSCNNCADIKNIKQNKILIIIVIVLGIITVGLSISIGFVARDNYLLKNPEKTIVQEIEFRVLEKISDDYSTRIIINVYNMSNATKEIDNSDFSVKPSGIIKFGGGTENCRLSSKDSISLTFTFYIALGVGETFSSKDVSKISLYYLGINIGTVKMSL